MEKSPFLPLPEGLVIGQVEISEAEAHGGRDLHTALRALSWVRKPLRPRPLPVPTNGPRRAMWRPQHRLATLCAQVFLLDCDLSPQGLC